MSKSTIFWIVAVALALITFAAVTGHLLGAAQAIDEARQTITEIRRDLWESQRQLDRLQREYDDLLEHFSRREAVLTAARDCGLSEDGARALWQAGKIYGVPHRLTLAVAQVESGCRDIIATNRNQSTDHGWMQLNSGTWPWLAAMTGRHDPHDEADNIFMGTWYLAHLNESYNHWMTTTSAFNRGPAGLEDYATYYGTTETPYSNKVKAVVAAMGGD